MPIRRPSLIRFPVRHPLLVELFEVEFFLRHNGSSAMLRVDLQAVQDPISFLASVVAQILPLFGESKTRIRIARSHGPFGQIHTLSISLCLARFETDGFVERTERPLQRERDLVTFLNVALRNAPQI